MSSSATSSEPPLLCSDEDEREQPMCAAMHHEESISRQFAASVYLEKPRNMLLRHLLVDATLLKPILQTLQRIQRLRIVLPDPLRGAAAPYNRDAGNSTLAQLVLDTEHVASTVVEAFVLHHQHSEELTKMEAVLHSAVEAALSDFYVDLSALMAELGEEAVSLMRGVSLPDAIECCREVARDHVRHSLGLVE